MYEGENVKVVYLYDYKATLMADYGRFYTICEKINPLYSIFRRARLCESEDVQYAFTDSVISALSPDVCLYVNVQEYGRVLTNVCAYHQIPSIFVDYAFSFDTYIMEKRIRFDIRACMSEITAQNWVKHKDPTPRRDIIGFCKIDHWRDRLINQYQADIERPFENKSKTILFVSTWAPNPNSPILTEKVQIVRKLSEVCLRHGWNLLVKKHPSEFDTLVNDVINKNGYANQIVVEHMEMSLFDCVYYSDFVCTQNSSAFIETLFLNKPFSYIAANGDNAWADMSYFAREKEVHTFRSVEDYEQYVANNEDEVSYQKLLVAFQKLQTKFLYKTDGNASKRLLTLVESYVK